MGLIKLDFSVEPRLNMSEFRTEGRNDSQWQFDVVAVEGISGPIDHAGTIHLSL